MDLEDNNELISTEEEVSSIEEGTAAADTLKPNGGSGKSESKSAMLDTFVSLMAKLGKEDLSKFYNDSIAQIGKEAEKIPGGAASSNKASINAKPSAASAAVKEDLDEMLGEEEDFSEDFKERASTLFEAAVNTRINLETIRLEEEFADKEAALKEELEAELQEKANEIFETVTDKLDQYLNYNVETYMEENVVAITSNIRTDLAENFICGLQNLFSEHYITVPEEKIDILGEMKSENAVLKDKLNEAINEKLELAKLVEDSAKDKIFSDVSEGLAETQREKMKILSEGVVYTDEENFHKKLETIKEAYFGKKSPSKDTGMITEEIDGELNEEEGTPYVAPGMDKYLKQIAKSVK